MLYSLKYNDNLPNGVGGRCTYIMSVWPSIVIRTKYKNDEGILEHELMHVHQFWTRGMIIHTARYKYSKTYRLKCEVEAYKVQLRFNPEYRDFYAERIVEMYGLDINKSEVLALL